MITDFEYEILSSVPLQTLEVRKSFNSPAAFKKQGLYSCFCALDLELNSNNNKKKVE